MLFTTDLTKIDLLSLFTYKRYRLYHRDSGHIAGRKGKLANKTHVAIKIDNEWIPQTEVIYAWHQQKDNVYYVPQQIPNFSHGLKKKPEPPARLAPAPEVTPFDLMDIDLLSLFDLRGMILCHKGTNTRAEEPGHIRANIRQLAIEVNNVWVRKSEVLNAWNEQQIQKERRHYESLRGQHNEHTNSDP